MVALGLVQGHYPCTWTACFNVISPLTRQRPQASELWASLLIRGDNPTLEACPQRITEHLRGTQQKHHICLLLPWSRTSPPRDEGCAHTGSLCDYPQGLSSYKNYPLIITACFPIPLFCFPGSWWLPPPAPRLQAPGVDPTSCLWQME